MTAAADENGKQSMASIAKNAIFVLAIYAYFAGWVYSYFLYNHFGIPLTSVEIPVYFFFIYSYSVIANWWIALACTVIVIVVYLIAINWPRVAVPVMIVLFPLVFYVSKDQAEMVAKEIRSGNAKTITFIFKEGTGEVLPQDFLDANKKRSLRLITLTPDRFYVLQQPLGEGNELPYGFTYALSKNDVLLAKIALLNVAKEVGK